MPSTKSSTKPACGKPTYAERQIEVLQIARFADDNAGSTLPKGVTVNADAQSRIDKYNAWKMDVEALWTKGEPKNHLNHLKSNASFTAPQKFHVLVDTVAKLSLADGKKTVLQALKEAEMEMEDVLSADADHEFRTYGTLPPWAPTGKW